MESTVAAFPPAPDGRRRTVGRLDIGVSALNGITEVSGLYQRTPLRALFPRPEVDDVPMAVVANTSGGIVGGDRLELNVGLEDRTDLLVTGQAAEKVYRSAGPESVVESSISVGQGARLEYLPQGTILFDGARFRRTTAIVASHESRVLAGEVLTLGRVERGETFESGLLHDEWRVRVGGRLIWVDAFHLSSGDAANGLDAFGSPAGFNSRPAYATFVYVATDALERVGLAREIQGEQDPDLAAGVTGFEGVLVARWLGRDPARVRDAFGRFWAQFRAAVTGGPARLPTIWNI